MSFKAPVAAVPSLLCSFSIPWIRESFTSAAWQWNKRLSSSFTLLVTRPICVPVIPLRRLPKFRAPFPADLSTSLSFNSPDASFLMSAFIALIAADALFSPFTLICRKFCANVRTFAAAVFAACASLWKVSTDTRLIVAGNSLIAAANCLTLVTDIFLIVAGNCFNADTAFFTACGMPLIELIAFLIAPGILSTPLKKDSFNADAIPLNASLAWMLKSCVCVVRFINALLTRLDCAIAALAERAILLNARSIGAKAGATCCNAAPATLKYLPKNISDGAITTIDFNQYKTSCSDCATSPLSWILPTCVCASCATYTISFRKSATRFIPSPAPARILPKIGSSASNKSIKGSIRLCSPSASAW